VGLDRSWLAIAAVWVASASTFAFVATASTGPTYLASLAASLAVETAFFGLATSIHRDFHGLYFVHTLSAWVATLANRRLLERVARSRSDDSTIRAVSLVILAAALAWIMAMGYAIVSRVEPRPIEALGYNAHFLSVSFALAVVGLRFRFDTRRVLEVDGLSIRFEGRDLGAILSEREKIAMAAFASRPGEGISCADLNRLDCGGCDQSMKASSCRRYRKTQEAVASLGKLLYAFSIGRIEAPPRRNEVLRDGWRFISGKDVDVQSRPSPPTG
jgi:hypothetical protein